MYRLDGSDADADPTEILRPPEYPDTLIGLRVLRERWSNLDVAELAREPAERCARADIDAKYKHTVMFTDEMADARRAAYKQKHAELTTALARIRSDTLREIDRRIRAARWSAATTWTTEQWRGSRAEALMRPALDWWARNNTYGNLALFALVGALVAAALVFALSARSHGDRSWYTDPLGRGAPNVLRLATVVHGDVRVPWLIGAPLAVVTPEADAAGFVEVDTPSGRANVSTAMLAARMTSLWLESARRCVCAIHVGAPVFAAVVPTDDDRPRVMFSPQPRDELPSQDVRVSDVFYDALHVRAPRGGSVRYRAAGAGASEASADIDARGMACVARCRINAQA